MARRGEGERREERLLERERRRRSRGEGERLRLLLWLLLRLRTDLDLERPERELREPGLLLLLDRLDETAVEWLLLGRYMRHSLDRHSRSPVWRSPSRHTKCSVERNLRITVGNDGIETPEKKRLSDRLGSPVDSLSDVDRVVFNKKRGSVVGLESVIVTARNNESHENGESHESVETPSKIKSLEGSPAMVFVGVTDTEVEVWVVRMKWLYGLGPGWYQMSLHGIEGPLGLQASNSGLRRDRRPNLDRQILLKFPFGLRVEDHLGLLEKSCQDEGGFGTEEEGPAIGGVEGLEIEGSETCVLPRWDDLAYGPILSRCLSHPQSLEQHPFDTRHEKDYCSRNVFAYQPDCTINDNHLQDQRRYGDRDDRLLDRSIDAKGFLPETQKYCKRIFSRSPSPTYMDEDFHALEIARRKREEFELKKKLSRELPGNSYTFSESTKSVKPSEPLYLHRPEEAPAMPKKSILKKRVDDPSVQPCSTDSFSLDVDNFLKQFHKNVVTESAVSKESQVPVHDWKPYSDQGHSTSFKRNSENFLMEKKHHVSELELSDQQRDFWLPHERASQDGKGFSLIPGMMTDSASIQKERRHRFPGDIEEEEKFLYGSADENDSHINSPSAPKLTLIDGKGTVKQKVSSLSLPSSSVKVDTSEESQPEYEKIHNMLKTIGLDIEMAEISKLAARTQERLHGKKPSRSPDRPLVVYHKSESRQRHRSRSDTHSPESSRKYSLSPPSSFLPSKDMSPISISDCSNKKTVGQDNPLGTMEQLVPSAPIIPSAPPCLPNSFPSPAALAWYNIPHFPPFTATQLPQSYPPLTMPSPGCFAYGQYMTYAAFNWPMYTQQVDPALSGIHKFLTPTMPVDFSQPNLSVIEPVSIGRGPPDIKRDESVFVQIPTSAQDSKLLPQLSLPALKGAKEKNSDKKTRASQRQKVIEEREKLKGEQEAQQKQLYYLRIELNRLSRVQEEMLQKKCKEKDPLLVEVSKLQESIAKEIAELEIKASVAEKKKSELDKVAQILGINIFEKSQKLSSENKESSDKSLDIGIPKGLEKELHEDDLSTTQNDNGFIELVIAAH
ncbi:hypothetical protein JD844_025005 [Phrynosoma platyrhinos]|uniref:Zinc finger protein 318 n=1 Tax=Phrynosoma platyrhinos TaxID=52577 RepID=A0ABQ7SYW1_PHRPL|nr:hypothetical protein JD844_025005 [Phrynosoma platyrhinos]